jgi:hypothetical protein
VLVLPLNLSTPDPTGNIQLACCIQSICMRLTCCVAAFEQPLPQLQGPRQPAGNESIVQPPLLDCEGPEHQLGFGVIETLWGGQITAHHSTKHASRLVQPPLFDC